MLLCLPAVRLDTLDLVSLPFAAIVLKTGSYCDVGTAALFCSNLPLPLSEISWCISHSASRLNGAGLN